MPTYHLAFCLTAIDYLSLLSNSSNPSSSSPSSTSSSSSSSSTSTSTSSSSSLSSSLSFLLCSTLSHWNSTYMTDGLIRGTPGWHFVDWSFTDQMLSAQSVPMADFAHAVCMFDNDDVDADDDNSDNVMR